MKAVLTYYKNSNSGELFFTQEFTETDITGIPIYFYGPDRKSIEQKSLSGCVTISDKKFTREASKILKLQK